jgi:hypothetical protein
MAQLAAVVLVGVTQRIPILAQGFSIGSPSIRRLTIQVLLGFAEHVLFDEPFVGQGERRILGEHLFAMWAAETHPPGRDDLDQELIKFRIEDADEELSAGAIVSGEVRRDKAAVAKRGGVVLDSSCSRRGIRAG